VPVALVREDSIDSVEEFYMTADVVVGADAISNGKLLFFIFNYIVLLLGIFRRVSRPAATRGALLLFYFPGGALPLKIYIYIFMIPAPSGSHLKCILNVLKLMGKHFIDPKRSEILSVFQVFPCTTRIAFFWPRLLPALFLRKP
jgi:hypothetical protein